MSNSIGSRFYKVDLHIHTPESSDYKQRDSSPQDIVDAAIEAGLDAIAVTDHNTILAIQGIQQAAAGTNLVVFPGFEINAQGGHLLALFDPSASLDLVGEALSDAGIGRTQWGSLSALGHDILRAIDIVAEKGGIAVAAHADGPQGFLEANSGMCQPF
jgi:histidinol phosphatase-like PHP family hydrolase